jgi:hypothetical protein
MKIMTKHSSATTRQQTLHLNETILIPNVSETTRTSPIVNALKRRAQAVINDKSIDARSRAIIRYGLETNDPGLPELVSRVDAGENIADTLDFSQTAATDKVDLSRAKIEALAEIICAGGSESAAALLVLMGALETSTHPEALAHTAKYFTFTRCGELNVYGMVEAQIGMIEGELLGHWSR